MLLVHRHENIILTFKHGRLRAVLLFIRQLKQRDTALYKLYRYVPPHRVVFLHRFGLKTGIHSALLGLESGMDFEGTTRVFKSICSFNSK